MPPKSMLLQADTGRTGGDLSAGTVRLRKHTDWLCVRIAAAGNEHWLVNTAFGFCF